MKKLSDSAIGNGFVIVKHVMCYTYPRNGNASAMNPRHIAWEVHQWGRLVDSAPKYEEARVIAEAANKAERIAAVKA